MHPRPAADQGGAVERLELLEVGGIDDAGDDFAHVEGRAQVLGDQAEQVLRVVLGLLEIRFGLRPEFAPVQVGHHFPAHANAVHFVTGQVVAQAGNAGVHVGAAQALLVGVLASGHLHQGRAAEKHPGLLRDEDVVVAHAGLIGPAGGGGTEHQRDGGDAHLGELSDFVEQPPGLGEVVDLPLDGRLRVAAGLAAQVGAGGFHELHIRHAVLAGDLQPPHQLLGVEGVERAGPYRRVVAEDDAFDVLDDADADHESGADGEGGAPSRQRADLQKG